MLHDIHDTVDNKPLLCENCGKETVYWIDHIPIIKILCPDCTHLIMRRLFEDLIQFHNRNNKGRHCSLVNIMYHGEHDLKEKRERKRQLFDF